MNLSSSNTTLIQSFQRFLNPVFGLDLGTFQTTFVSPQHPSSLHFATDVAYSSKTNKYYFGQEAREMRGRVGEEIRFCPAFQRGWVEDKSILKRFLRFCLATQKKHSFLRSTWLVSYSLLSTETDRQLLEDILFELGAKEVIFIPQLLLSALGGGVPITDTSGNLFFQIGAGVIEGAIISLGTLVRSVAIPYGSKELDQRIRSWFRIHKKLDIGDSTATDVKEQLAVVESDQSSSSFIVKGRDVVLNLPKEVRVSVAELQVVLQPWVEQIVRNIESLLHEIPSDLAPDVLDKGLLLSGGGANITGIDEVISMAVRLPVSIAEQPALTVYKGLQALMNHLPEYRKSFLFLAKEVA